MKTIVIAHAAILLLVLSFNSSDLEASEISPNDLRPKAYVSGVSDGSPMSGQERVKLIDLLEKMATSYLTEVKNISWLTFKGKNLPADHVAALNTEASDVKTMIESFLVQLRALRRDHFNTKRWVILTREFFLMSSYAEDLDRNEIVASQDYVRLRLFMPFVFDRVVLADMTEAPKPMQPTR